MTFIVATRTGHKNEQLILSLFGFKHTVREEATANECTSGQFVCLNSFCNEILLERKVTRSGEETHIFNFLVKIFMQEEQNSPNAQEIVKSKTEK